MLQEIIPLRCISSASVAANAIHETWMTHVVAQMATAIAAHNECDLWRDEREERAIKSRGLADFRMHDPPKFHGDIDPEKAEKWLQEVEKIFEVNSMPTQGEIELHQLPITWGCWVLVKEHQVDDRSFSRRD